MSLSATIAQAAATAAENGQHVNVLAKYPQAALRAVEQKLQPDLTARTCRANGAESIDTHTGGTIRIGRSTAAFRGAHCALLIVPIGVDRGELIDLMPSNPIEIIGYY